MCFSLFLNYNAVTLFVLSFNLLFHKITPTVTTTHLLVYYGGGIQIRQAVQLFLVFETILPFFVILESSFINQVISQRFLERESWGK